MYSEEITNLLRWSMRVNIQPTTLNSLTTPFKHFNVRRLFYYWHFHRGTVIAPETEGETHQPSCIFVTCQQYPHSPGLLSPSTSLCKCWEQNSACSVLRSHTASVTACQAHSLTDQAGHLESTHAQQCVYVIAAGRQHLFVFSTFTLLAEQQNGHLVSSHDCPSVCPLQVAVETSLHYPMSHQHMTSTLYVIKSYCYITGPLTGTDGHRIMYNQLSIQKNSFSLRNANLIVFCCH